MIEVLDCILQGSSDVLILDIWIVAQYLGTLGAASQHIQNIDDANALAANAWPSPADLRINRDAFETAAHRPIIPNFVFGRILPGSRRITPSAAEAAR